MVNNNFEPEQLLDIILDHTPILIAYLDREFNFIRVNRAYASGDNHDVSFFPGKNHFDLYPNKENEENFKRVVETGEPFSITAKPFEYKEHPERGISYWDWSLIPVKDIKGNIEGLVFTLQDVTERRVLEQKLRKSEEKYRLITENANDAITIINDNYKIEYVNAANYKMLGRSAVESIGRSVAEIIHPNDLELTAKKLKEGFEKGYGRLEVRIQHKNGQYIWVDAIGRVYVDENGDRKGIMISRDITDRKKLETLRRNYTQDLEMEVKKKTEELVQAEKLASIGMLSAGIAHEINNPIMGIINYSHIIKSELESIDNFDLNQKPYSFLDKIIKEGERIAKIASDLLIFARKDTGEFVYENISDVINSCGNLIALKSRASQIEIDLDIHKDLPKIPMRVQNIQQVILNVLQNSIDALNQKFGTESLDEKKKILVNVSEVVKEKINYVKISVTDNGEGIEEKFLQKVFDPFFTTKIQSHEYGTGLGLSVSYDIIEEHNGSIQIQSEWKKGTTVDVFLPIVR